MKKRFHDSIREEMTAKARALLAFHDPVIPRLCFWQTALSMMERSTLINWHSVQDFSPWLAELAVALSGGDYYGSTREVIEAQTDPKVRLWLEFVDSIRSAQGVRMVEEG